MPSVATGSITITSAATALVAAEHNWLLVKQPAIPEEHKIATPQDASAMLNQLRSGRSAYAAINSCPVRRSQASGAWKASYTAEIEVHCAEGVDYELEITKDGVLLDAQGPMLTHNRRSESYDVDYNQTQQLGWRPVFNTFSALWEQGGVYNEDSQRLTITPAITHDDGVAYIDAPAFGTFRGRGLAEYDLWKVNIEHQLGTEWTASLWAVAWWPKGLAREFQQSEYCEIKLPQCVVDAMNECPNAKADDGTGTGEEDGTGTEDRWTVQVNPPRTAEVNKCNGEVLEITYESN